MVRIAFLSLTLTLIALTRDLILEGFSAHACARTNSTRLRSHVVCELGSLDSEVALTTGRGGIDGWGSPRPGRRTVLYMLKSSDGGPAWSRGVAEGYYRFDVLRK